MATISCTILNTFPSKLPLNLPKLTPLNNNPLHFHNHGSSFSSRTSKLSVKLDDFQDPLRINEIEKVEKNKVMKERYDFHNCVVSQTFLIRSYEVDVHQNATLDTLVKYPQSLTSINLFQNSGMIEGYGESEEMTRNNLIWVIGRMQVAVNSYPSWGDTVQVETWCSALGEYGSTSSSRLTNYKTGKKIMRVDTYFMMMNKNTRRVSKFPEELRTKLEPFVRENFDPLTIDNKRRRLRKLNANRSNIRVEGIKPMWFDLDPNQHVNNVKYVNWILEGTPELVRENSELAELTVEYRRECGRENVLQSLSTTSSENPLEFDHLLCLENGKEVARSRTLWRSRT